MFAADCFFLPSSAAYAGTSLVHCHQLAQSSVDPVGTREAALDSASLLVGQGGSPDSQGLHEATHHL